MAAYCLGKSIEIWWNIAWSQLSWKLLSRRCWFSTFLYLAKSEWRISCNNKNNFGCNRFCQARFFLVLVNLFAYRLYEKSSVRLQLRLLLLVLVRMYCISMHFWRSNPVVTIYSHHFRQSPCGLPSPLLTKCLHQGGGWSYHLNYEIYSFYIAPCNGLQGAVAQYAANQTRNTWANPFFFSISVLLHVLHNTQD